MEKSEENDSRRWKTLKSEIIVSRPPWLRVRHDGNKVAYDAAYEIAELVVFAVGVWRWRRASAKESSEVECNCIEIGQRECYGKNDKMSW